MYSNSLPFKNKNRRKCEFDRKNFADDINGGHFGSGYPYLLEPAFTTMDDRSPKIPSLH
jgi:hypothetical protein